MTTGCEVSPSAVLVIGYSPAHRTALWRFWDLTAGSANEKNLCQNSAVWTVAISGDDMKVAIGLESGALKVVDKLDRRNTL